MTPEELKAIEERDKEDSKYLFAQTYVYFDRAHLLAEVKRLQKFEQAIGAPQRRLIEENERLKKELDAANICTGCAYVGTVGCHCARAPWRT